ncbi:MAG: hypothetical protein HY075_09440 [Deltaproteobacteria bacterium]|nr:hypothetical protein [Deltaproteobacteria bacterium]
MSLSIVLALASVGCDFSGMVGKTEAAPSATTGGTRSSSPLAAKSSDISALVSNDLVSGFDVTYGFAKDGAVFCWGKCDTNVGYCAKSPAEACQPTHPYLVSDSDANVLSVATGGYATYRVYRYNIGATGPQAPARNYSAIAVGDAFACGIAAADGSVVCWSGMSSDHVTGEVVAEGSPLHPPAGIWGAKAIVAGSQHACIINHDDAPVCWPSLVGAYGTQPPTDLKQVKALSARNFRTCAIDASNAVRCWGYAPVVAGDPQQPEGLKARAVAVGAWHACAIGVDGKIACWGSNDLGALDAPKDITAVQLSAGASHSCALASDGRVRCWGTYGNGGDDSGFAVPTSGGFGR